MGWRDTAHQAGKAAFPGGGNGQARCARRLGRGLPHHIGGLASIEGKAGASMARGIGAADQQRIHRCGIGRVPRQRAHGKQGKTMRLQPHFPGSRHRCRATRLWPDNDDRQAHGCGGVSRGGGPEK